MKVYVFLILLFFFFGKNVFGQIDSTLIEQATQFKYAYQNQRYNKKELGSIIQSNTIAYNSYKKYRSLNTASGIGAGASIISFSVAYYISKKNCEGDDSCHGDFIFSIVGAATTASAFVVFLSSRIKFYKSIRLFNADIQASHKIGSTPIELNLKYSASGIGLVLHF